MCAGAMAVLGLPPVDLHGPLHHLGVMGPTCGMTRAVRALARSEVEVALEYNPAVVLLPVLALLAWARTAVGVLRASWFEVSVRWSHPAVALPLGLATLALWVHQQSNASMLATEINYYVL